MTLLETHLNGNIELAVANHLSAFSGRTGQCGRWYKLLRLCVGMLVCVYEHVQHGRAFPLLRTDQYMSRLVGQCPPVTWLQ